MMVNGLGFTTTKHKNFHYIVLNILNYLLPSIKLNVWNNYSETPLNQTPFGPENMSNLEGFPVKRVFRIGKRRIGTRGHV